MTFTWLLSPLGRKLAFAAIVAAALGAGYLYLTTKHYNRGYDAHRDAVEKQDSTAVEAAESARKRVRACRDSGGEWDIETGSCK
jgi:hypothetical protein